MAEPTETERRLRKTEEVLRRIGREARARAGEGGKMMFAVADGLVLVEGRVDPERVMVRVSEGDAASGALFARVGLDEAVEALSARRANLALLRWEVLEAAGDVATAERVLSEREEKRRADDEAALAAVSHVEPASISEVEP